MNGIGPVITTSIRNNLRSRTLLIVFIGLGVMLALAVALCISLLIIAPTVEENLPDMESDLELYLGSIMYCASLFGVGICINVFAASSMTREKSRGNIESLLATPLKVKGIWLAKSLAVFLPGLVLAEVLTAIALVAINYIYFVPEIGFLINPWIAISSFVMVPLMYFCISLLTHLIGLTGSPNTANAVVQVFLPLILALMMNLGLRETLDMTSWHFTLINLGIAAVIGIVVVLLYPRLTKERIVLSCRE